MCSVVIFIGDHAYAELFEIASDIVRGYVRGNPAHGLDDTSANLGGSKHLANVGVREGVSDDHHARHLEDGGHFCTQAFQAGLVSTAA